MIDTSVSCILYAKSFQNSLQNLLNIETKNEVGADLLHGFEPNDEIYFSVLFTGQVYGEFLIGLTKKTALELLGIQSSDLPVEELYRKNRTEVLATFSELVNIASGSAIGSLLQAYPEISITSPRSIEGSLTIGKYEIKRSRLIHKSGVINCYIYVDQMRLNVAEALRASKDQLKEESNKQEELRRLNKAKSEFLANMSHELRTPLNGMLGMLDLMRGTELTGAQKEQLEIVSRSGDFLLTIINDILEFSRMESGNFKLESRNFNLRDTIESVAESLANEVFAKDLEFYMQLDASMNSNFQGDDTRIKQILINLLGNAIKFTPTGSVSLIGRMADLDSVELRVIDTGIGIPKAKLDSIFESFTQADVSDSRRYGGSGLGLSISKSIVQAMGGKIKVKSQEAVGSEFVVTIPLKKLSDGDVCHTSKVRKIMTLIGDINLENTVGRYIREMYPTVGISNFHDFDPSITDKEDLVLLDYRSWIELQDESKAKALATLKRHMDRVVFLVKPSELPKLSDIKEAIKASEVHYLHLPIRYRQLDHLLNGPVAKDAKAEAVVQVEPAEQKSDGKKVLLVEDNKINQTVISTMLKTLKFEVTIAEHGAEALEKLKHQSYDIMLLDCQMPVMDGYTTVKHVREKEKGTSLHLPVIALTANAFRETKQQCFEFGMDEFLTKPVKVNELKFAIDATIKKARSVA